MWVGSWRNPNNQLYQYSHSQINNINELNELEESKARRQVAINWIIENPIDEIKLIFKKIVIYLLPKNYNRPSSLHPINLIVHVLFFCYIFMKLYNRTFKLNDLIIFSPIVASIILSIVFFVGYRWRYYAEPFIIIFAWQLISILKEKYERKKIPSP
jgi:hypothetical protein